MEHRTLATRDHENGHAHAPAAERRALVWVDHHETRIVRPIPESKLFDASSVTGDGSRPHERKHDGGHRHPVGVRYADAVAEALRGFGDLVITGPSTAKDELLAHLRERHAEIADRVSVVKTLDRATDAQLAATARELFTRLDRMRGIHLPPAPG
jgi:hypothetical protein